MKTKVCLFSALLLAGLFGKPAAAQSLDVISVVDTTAAEGETPEIVEIVEADDEYRLVVRRVGEGGGGKRGGTDNDFRGPKRWKWHGGHWAGVGIYYNGLVRNLGRLSLPSGAEYLHQTPASVGVNVNFVDLTLVSNRHFGLITGLGLEMNNFRFDRNITLMRDEAGVVVPDYRFDEAGIELKKSKLTTVYLNIPLLVEFQFGRSKAGKRCPGFVNFGLVGGVRLQGHTKVKYRDADGDMHTVKGHEGLNLRNFHGGVECNVGYRWVALSARYYPHSIFAKDGGPEVQQVNIGLSLMF